MAIFTVTSADKKISLTVRAPCLSCARKHAAEYAPAGEFKNWLHASVQVDYNPQQYPEGRTEILERVEHE